MHRSPGEPPADTAPVRTRSDGVGRRSRWDLSTLRELWRFKDYGRPERRPLALPVPAVISGRTQALITLRPTDIREVGDDDLVAVRPAGASPIREP